MMFTHLLLRLASMPLTPTPPNVNLTLTVQWVGMDGFPYRTAVSPILDLLCYEDFNVGRSEAESNIEIFMAQ